MTTTTRAIITPNVTSDFAKGDGPRVFWKQILPKRTVHYTDKAGERQVVNFDDAYLADLANSTAVDSVGFLLADESNRHTMDPERWRASVTTMEVREDGLYGKFEFPSAAHAKAVLDNPNLGVSARIREGINKDDGSTVSRGIIHVLGTLDPQVGGMSPWQTADLSATDDDVLDLSNEEFEDMAKETAPSTEVKDLAEYTADDIDKMSDAELDAFLAKHAPDFDGTLGDVTTESNDDADEKARAAAEAAAKSELVGAGAELSADAKRDIELANTTASAAQQRANDALKRMAEAEWRETKASYLSAGVPPHLLDLAAPVLNRPDEMVIDLSHTDDEDVNVTAIVRGLLDAAKGTVDLANEAGHTGSFNGEGADPDAELLAAWDKQS